jgi:hypothetical protein
MSLSICLWRVLLHPRDRLTAKASRCRKLQTDRSPKSSIPRINPNCSEPNIRFRCPPSRPAAAARSGSRARRGANATRRALTPLCTGSYNRFPLLRFHLTATGTTENMQRRDRPQGRNGPNEPHRFMTMGAQIFSHDCKCWIKSLSSALILVNLECSLPLDLAQIEAADSR